MRVRKRLALLITIGMTALPASLVVAAPAHAAQVLVVDDDGAQCGTANLRSIAEAVDRARDGDRIRVCPGTYTDSFVVSKSVRIEGPVRSVRSLGCFAEWPDELDPTRFAIIEPPQPRTREADEPLVSVAADGVDVSGLVFQHVVDDTWDTDPTGTYGFAAAALTTSDAFAGYRIHDNVFRGNTLALELGSDGGATSRADANCFRENGYAIANQRMRLSDAVIASNSTYRTGSLAYEIGWGYRGTDAVSLTGNVSGSDWSVFQVQNTTGSRVAGNTVSYAKGRAIEVARGNTDVTVSGNHVTNSLLGILIAADNVGVRVVGNTIDAMESFADTPNGIVMDPPSANAPEPSAGVVVQGNSVSNLRRTDGAIGGAGIGAAPGAMQGAIVTGNTLTGNGAAGIVLTDGNSDNTIRGNTAIDNRVHGIRIQGVNSSGNLIIGNRMSGSAVADARDESDPDPTDGIQLQNTWTGNRCVIDLPAGAIC